MRSLLAVAMGLGLAGLCAGQNQSSPPKRAMPLPGETFLVEGCVSFVIPAKEAKADSPKPWVFYAPTLPGLPDAHEKWLLEQLVKAGIAIGGIDVGESFGNPKGRALYTAFHREMVERRGFWQKPCLLARSRGGLMLLNWAAEHPESVSGIAGIYPVCNLRSYPGLARASGAYGLSADDLEKKLTDHNPLDRLAPLAKAKVPVFFIHGDKDTVVPLDANSGELAKRYRALGGTMQLVVAKGQGHNYWEGFFRCQELVDFVIRHAK